MCVCGYVWVKSARRELEHQRQLEWERQRRDQLMAETQREHSQVDRLRLEIGQHRQELDSVVCPRLFLCFRLPVSVSLSQSCHISLYYFFISRITRKVLDGLA